MRFYPFTKGKIRIGGIDIRDLAQDTVRELIAIVELDTYLFDVTIREQIAVGNLNASMDDIVRVAKAAQIHEFIMSLPKGYDTPTGERRPIIG